MLVYIVERLYCCFSILWFSLTRIYILNSCPSQNSVLSVFVFLFLEFVTVLVLDDEMEPRDDIFKVLLI